MKDWLSSHIAFTRVDQNYYNTLTSNGLLYDNANVFLGGFDDKKQERKAQE